MQYFTMTSSLPLYIPYPRFLLDMPLSETARLVYSLILSRIQLSQLNHWVDPEGKVYCRYTIQDLKKDTGKSKSTIVTALADLEAHGLLIRCRAGARFANKLYLRMPRSCTSDGQKIAHQMAEKPASNNKKNKSNQPDYSYKGDSF